MNSEHVAGQTLGHYQVLDTIGAGGMGRVYRAHDPRLHRDVAIKVLLPEFSDDPDRLRRFEQEARAAAALNHPNILAVYDIGSEGGSPYVVSELLKGETLRHCFHAGPVPQRKAIDYARQIARGLAAAHDAGIVHRDIKPENIFVTDDGHVKILDFGLAKLSPTAPLGHDTDTRTAMTASGQIFGTVGYMSPEQVRGGTADTRSDIFSLGAVLYEMFSGQRAFRGQSAADTLSAILNSDPPPQPPSVQPLPPALERLVLHCLEKKPAERFQSAHDIAFSLETLDSINSATAHIQAPHRSRRWWRWGLAATAIVLVAGGVLLAGRLTVKDVQPTYHQLTYLRGTVTGARFMPDGQNIVYAAAWEGNVKELFQTRYDNNESRPLNVKGAELLAISTKGDLAILRGSVLYSFPSTGAEPKDGIEQNVVSADYGPDGVMMAIIRGEVRPDKQVDAILEYPRGTTLIRRDVPAGRRRAMANVRVSGDGKYLAFFDLIEGPYPYGNAVIIDAVSGNTVARSNGLFGMPQGMCWSASSKEVWFSGGPEGEGQLSVMAMDLSGRVRLVLRLPAQSSLKDISPDGRVLLSRNDQTFDIMAQAPGETTQRRLTWFGWSILEDISDDGQTILFLEAGRTGSDWGEYVRNINGAAAKFVGVGVAGRLSLDGRQVVTTAEQVLRILQVGPGAQRDFPLADLTDVTVMRPLPSGTPLISGAAPGRERRTYVVPSDGSPIRPVTPEGVVAVLPTPDGKHLLSRQLGWQLYPVDGGAPIKLPTPSLAAGSVVAGWGDSSGNKVYLVAPSLEDGLSVGWTVTLLDLYSGKQTPGMTIRYPGDRAGLLRIARPFLSRDGTAFAYSVSRILSQLYVVEDLR